MEYIYKTTKGFRIRLFLLFLTVIFSTVTGALFPYAIGEIVDQIFYIREIKGFLIWFFIYAGLYLLNQSLHGGLNYIWAHLEVTYLVEIRRQCFAHLLRLRAAVWTKIHSGDVMRRIMDDTECFLEFIHRSLFYVLANVIQLMIAIGYLFYTNLLIGIISLVMTPVMAYSIRFFQAKLKKKYQEMGQQRGLVDAWILEMMTGIREWKLLGAADKVREDYRQKTEEIVRQEKKTGYIGVASDSVNQALTLAGQLCIFCAAAAAVGRGTMTVGQFVACAAYFSTCASYYNALGRKMNAISGNMAGIKRVEDFMSWEEEEDGPEAEDLPISEGSIRLENVSFGYSSGGSASSRYSVSSEDVSGKDVPDESGTAMVLKNVSLEITAGEKLAFVGKSGEGKSTLLQLLYRLYEPDEGTVYVDGRELSRYTLSCLRGQIAVVQQENGLFHGSLRENISLSKEKAQEERIWRILEGLCLRELVEGLPAGLDTVIGSDGREFSGGQRQRIAIARCIYRKPKILLLDEATSALDAKTEAAVNACIYRELPDTTILSVAHRFSTVLASKRAVVMEQGRISAVGTHEELLRTNALYQTLYREYQKGLQKKRAGGADER